MRYTQPADQMKFTLSSQAAYYCDKYGEDVILRLKEAADFWEAEGKLKKRNLFLRLADEIQMEYPHLNTSAEE